MTTFASFLSRDNVAEFADYFRANPKPEGKYSDAPVEAWYKKYQDERDVLFIKPAMEFFNAKLAAGELQPVANGAGHSTLFTSFWDGLVTGTGKQYEKEWALDNIEQMIEGLCISPRFPISKFTYAEADEVFDVDEIYKACIEVMDAGEFKSFETNSSGSCNETGEFISVEFENWIPYIGTYNAGHEWVRFVPAAVPKKQIQTKSIELKTGNLVAMDWFRGLDGAFKDYTEKKEKELTVKGYLPSVNSRAGVLFSTEFYANLGIVHVFVGNSSPEVFTDDNGLIAVGSNWCEYTPDGRERYSDCDDDGNESEEAYEAYEHAMENPPEGMENHGRVCTDLWWITMIERERLAEILLEQLGEEHRAAIDEYVNDEFDVCLNVEPGKYTLYYDGHPSTFYELLEDKTQFRIGTPYFALTKDNSENTTEQSAI